MLLRDDLPGAIRGLLSQKLLIEVDSADADLLKSGVLDSLALIELLVHLESAFGVRISLADIELEDLRSINAIAALVAKQESFPSSGQPLEVAANR